MSNFCLIPARSFCRFHSKLGPILLGTFPNKKKGFACKLNKALKIIYYM